MASLFLRTPFSDRVSPALGQDPFGTTPVIQADELPPIDVVVVSHNHYDHLDLLNRGHREPGALLVPLRNRALLESVGSPTWSSWTGGKRTRWGTDLHGDASTALIRTWALRPPGRAVVWMGWRAEGLSLLLRRRHGLQRARFQGDWGEVWAFDLALIPIGAYEPAWFMKTMHINPEEAVRIHQEVGSGSLSPSTGTFPLTAESPDEPPLRLKKRLKTQGWPKTLQSRLETRREYLGAASPSGPLGPWSRQQSRRTDRPYRVQGWGRLGRPLRRMSSTFPAPELRSAKLSLNNVAGFEGVENRRVEESFL